MPCWKEIKVEGVLGKRKVRDGFCSFFFCYVLLWKDVHSIILVMTF